MFFVQLAVLDVDRVLFWFWSEKANAEIPQRKERHEGLPRWLLNCHARKEVAKLTDSDMKRLFVKIYILSNVNEVNECSAVYLHWYFLCVCVSASSLIYPSFYEKPRRPGLFLRVCSGSKHEG